jgi:hypothetical protein
MLHGFALLISQYQNGQFDDWMIIFSDRFTAHLELQFQMLTLNLPITKFWNSKRRRRVCFNQLAVLFIIARAGTAGPAGLLFKYAMAVSKE